MGSHGPLPVLRLGEADPARIGAHVARVLDGSPDAGAAAEVAAALAADTRRHYWSRPVEVRMEPVGGALLRISIAARQPALPSGDTRGYLATVARLAVRYGMGSTEHWASIWADLHIRPPADDHA